MAEKRQALGPRLERLYEDYNREDSASDPVQIVRRYSRRGDQEIVGFCAAALAFGRVQSVLNTVDTLARALGPAPADFVRTFDPKAPHPEVRAMVHRWTRGVDIVALLWLLRQMIDRVGVDRGVLSPGLRSWRDRHRRRARQFFPPGAGARPSRGLRPARAGAGRRLLFFYSAVGGQRLQAAEPVPAVDGPPRCGRPRRVDVDFAVAS